MGVGTGPHFFLTKMSLMLTKDLGRQSLFVWGYPNPDSLLAYLPPHQAFRTHCCIQLLPAGFGHPTTTSIILTILYLQLMASFQTVSNLPATDPMSFGSPERGTK